jgi:hypothetical protein
MLCGLIPGDLRRKLCGDEISVINFFLSQQEVADLLEHIRGVDKILSLDTYN